MSYFISFLIALVVSALVIYIVGRLNLGLTVSGFTAAIIAALVIAVVGEIVMWLLGLLGITFGGGLLGAIVYIIVAAIILMISDRFVPGMKVNGFTGAIIAAIAIGVVGWIVPAIRGEALLFGVDGGAVRADRDPATERDAVQHLVAAGARPRRLLVL